jgi:hypothetical protein
MPPPGSHILDLQSYSFNMGMERLDIFRHPRVQRVIRGINIFRGARKAHRRERLPIARDLLLRILAKLEINTQEGAIYHPAFCTAFDGFLRVGDFTWTSTEWLLGTADFAKWHVTPRSASSPTTIPASP